MSEEERRGETHKSAFRERISLFPKQVPIIGAGLLWLLPASFVAYAGFFHQRPWWSFRYDPEMIFYWSGHSLLAGAGVTNVDHPGFITHYASTALAAFWGTAPENIPMFLTSGYLIAFVLNSIAVILLIYYLGHGQTVAANLCAALALIAAPRFLEMAVIWTTELWYPLVSSIALAGTVAWIRKPDSWKIQLLCGCGLGLLLATKFLFVAWLPGIVATAIFLSAAARKLIRSLATIMVGIVVGFAIPSVIAVDRWSYMASWISRLATREGRYGTGNPGIPDVSTLHELFKTLSVNFSAWTLIWFLALFLIAIRIRREPGMAPEEKPIVIFCCVAMGTNVALLLRGAEEAARYLLPSAILVIPLVLFAMRQVEHLRWARLLALILISIVASKSFILSVNVHDRQVEAAYEMRSQVEQYLARLSEEQCAVIGWRFPHPAIARKLSSPVSFEHLVDREWPRIGYASQWTGVRMPPACDSWNLAIVQEPFEDGRIIGSLGKYSILTKP